MSVLLDGICLQLLNEILQLLYLVLQLNLLPSFTVRFLLHVLNLRL